MKVFIGTDMEGISGIDTMEQVSDVASPGHRFACERLMADTNAAADGAFAAGADTVYVIDGHNGSNSFIDEMLDPRIIKVNIRVWEKLLAEEKIDAYLHIGAHAMPGTIGGFLDHVQGYSCFDYSINGVSYGEIGQDAFFAGVFGIPVVTVSGDQAACDEAVKTLNNGIQCAVVKKGLCRNRAELVPLDEAENRIREAARVGVSRYNQMKPFILSMPLTVRTVYTRTDYCDEALARRPDARRIDARTAERTVDKVERYSDILI